MANVVGDIAIQVGADIGPLVRELGKASGAVSKFGKDAQASGGGMALASKAGVALGAAVLTAGAAMVSFTRDAMNNIDALSKQARVAGVAVSTFQAMALVAEEAGVSAEALSKSLVKMQDNITSLGRGGAAQVSAFEKLGVSFNDLAKLSTDAQFELIAERISAITDPATRTSAALDVFGKSGADALNMMTGYSAAVANAAAFQQEFGLAVSDLDAANIEAANDAMGRVGMAVSGLGTQFAVDLAPAITETANAMANWLASLTGADAALTALLGNADRAKAILGEDVVNAILKSGEVSDQTAVSIADLGSAYDGLGRDVSVAIKSIGDQIPVLLENGLDQMALDLSDVSGEMEALQGKFDRGAISADEYESQMSATLTRATQLLEEAGRIDGVDMSGAIGQVGALAGALAVARDVAARLRSLMPGSTSAAGPGPSFEKSGRGGSPAGVVVQAADGSTPRPQSAPSGAGGIDWGAPDVGGTGGDGGGGSDPMQAKTDALIESLKTQTEIVNEWYIASQEALQLASDAELAIIGGRQTAIERLEEEHQARLSGIKEAGNQFSVQSALEGGAMILGAMASTNKKAAKAQAIFAAGSALISAYQGAAKELEKGTFGFASAAAVIAKGIAFVSAIKSAGSSASGGGGGGGAVSGAGASAASSGGSNPLEVNLNTYGAGDFMAKMDVASLLSRLNDEAGDRGYRIMVPA